MRIGETVIKRLASGGLLALFVALALLVHHGSIGRAVSPGHPPAHSMAMNVVMSAEAGGSLSLQPDHDTGGSPGVCGMSATQLCAAPSIDQVVAVSPPLAVPAWEGILARPRSTFVTGPTIARAPPDLTVLSVSRI